MSARTALAALALLVGLMGVVVAPGAARAFEDRSAHVVVDAATGAILSASKPNHPRYPASLTKMMTVLMLFRALDAGTITPDTEIPISQTAAAANPVKLGLAPGQSVTVAEAIPALIARSANDVAVAVAEHLAGTEALFALEMTRVARTELGMTRTTFRNASGLPDDAHVSTALDMARLARVLWRDHAGRFGVFATETFTFRGQALPSYNGLLRSYDGADGLKTGFTCAAGYNLAGTAQRDGQRVISVAMGHASSADRWATSERLLDAGFAMLAPAAEADEPADEADPATVPTVADDSAEGAPVVATQAVRVPALSDLLTLNGLSIPRPLRAEPPPDAEGCGGLYAGGWAVTLGAFRSSGQARNLAARAARIYGGKPLTAPVGTGGMVRHHAFVAALSSGQARSICRQRQARGQYCLVRSPKMMWAAMAAVTRLRRSMQ
jgi:D-alanyl-D-alanine carboxypeptidase